MYLHTRTWKHHCFMNILTLGAHAQEGYSTCLVCVWGGGGGGVVSVCYHSSTNIAGLYTQNKVRSGLS